MGWFDDQIRQRKISDDEAFSESFRNLGDTVMGRRYRNSTGDDSEKTKSAMDEIIHYYHGTQAELPDTVKDKNEALEFLCRPNGIMHRTVHLTEHWYKEASGAFLAEMKDGSGPVALLPDPAGLGYTYPDAVSGKRKRVNAKAAEMFEKNAICFYKPLPLRKLKTKDLLLFGMMSWTRGNLVMLLGSMLVVTLLGLLTTKMNHFLTSEVLQIKKYSLLVSTMSFMLSLSVTQLLLGAFRQLVHTRGDQRMNVDVQAAIMMRVLSLPADFFKKYSSGEIHSRINYMSGLCGMMVSTVFDTGVTSLFSLMYITQVFRYAPALVLPSLVITLSTVVLSTVTAFCQMRITKREMEISASESGMTYAMINGIQKIRLAGAEKRAFARWANIYNQRAAFAYNPPAFLKLNGVFSTAISLAGCIVMYYIAVKSGVSEADYYSFNGAWGQVSASLSALAGIVTTVAGIKPSLDMAKPLMDAVPDTAGNKQMVTRLTGSIELNNISFRYDDNSPYVLDDLSLKIRPGQYVAIVGKTGCGKSTLVRIMLGFEKPQMGAVYYDGKDISMLDLRSLRRNIGTVMQNGKLFQGDIYSNIVISAPQLTMDDAWAAAEQADVADDIREMPMGMHTLISEGAGGISGGQRQRLMIARAIAPRPKILIFDEATSALDNITQKKVSESLDALKCTRVVIAHRLSTIRHCDRIILLENGRIAEDGTYEELIAMNGAFADLVRRQLIDERPEAASGTKGN